MVGRNSTFDANYAEPILPPVPIINLGTVTTRESVFVNITVVNNTSFIQEFGFLSLPDVRSFQISPDSQGVFTQLGLRSLFDTV